MKFKDLLKVLSEDLEVSIVDRFYHQYTYDFVSSLQDYFHRYLLDKDVLMITYVNLEITIMLDMILYDDCDEV